MSANWEQLRFGEEPEPGPDPPTMICPTCAGKGFVPYVPEALAGVRNADPDTSQDAAARKRTSDIGRFSHRSRQAKLLRAISQSHSGLTAYEAATMVLASTDYHTRIEGCRRRVSDLAQVGYIEDSGRRCQNPGSPDPAIMWKITPYGLQALANLRETGWSR